jgi:hypothetical protein
MLESQCAKPRIRAGLVVPSATLASDSIVTTESIEQGEELTKDSYFESADSVGVWAKEICLGRCFCGTQRCLFARVTTTRGGT